ncbi:MAG: hypothetical protein J6A94_05095 [Lachnospiraceae bacterium]|nr:hypothetical protein [Lachnospiraceae bacterium]
MDKLNDTMKQLQNNLESQVEALEPAPFQPVDGEEWEWETVSFDGTQKDNTAWLALISEHIKSAKSFEIQCWEDEVEEMILAPQYGEIKPSNWKKGTIVEGIVTSDFIRMVLEMPKPKDRESYNKMTPFFDIAFDNGFSSQHYGTEVIIKKKR